MKVNYFQLGVAIMQAVAVVAALKNGNPLQASLLACYVVANVIISFMNA